MGDEPGRGVADHLTEELVPARESGVADLVRRGRPAEQGERRSDRRGAVEDVGDVRELVERTGEVVRSGELARCDGHVLRHGRVVVRGLAGGCAASRSRCPVGCVT